jgi:hypothetical protein
MTAELQSAQTGYEAWHERFDVDGETAMPRRMENES